MKKGITFFIGRILDPEYMAKNIKAAGIDCVLTSADPRFDYQFGDIDSQVKIFKKYGLSLSSLHMQYKTEELSEFWKNSQIGDKLEKNLIKDVKTAAKYGFTCVVVHLFGGTNDIGFTRLERVLKVCEKLNVPLAIENINDNKTFFETFDKIKSPYLKFCYDSGHNHIFDPEIDYFSIPELTEKLIALHLHDNMGNRDAHTLNKYGNIDWDKIAQGLAKVPNEFSLDYELLFHAKCDESPEEIYAEAYSQACELERMIEKYKNK